MLIGIIVLIIGIVLLVNELNLGFQIDFDMVWSIILIVVALYYMAKSRKVSLWTLIVLFIGTWSLLEYLDVVTAKVENLFWPIVVIIAGLSIVFSKMTWRRKLKDLTKFEVGKDGRLIYSGIFGGTSEKLQTNDFKGAVVNSVFGAVDLNIKRAKIKEDVIIDVNSIFGGTNIIVSDNYNIKLNSVALFGGNSNDTGISFDENRKTIYINCVSIFGGTEIKLKGDVKDED